MSDTYESEQTGDDSYQQLLELEELESLQEEIDETGADVSSGLEQLPPDLRSHLDGLGITSMSDLLNRVAAMHAELDEAEEFS